MRSTLFRRLLLLVTPLLVLVALLLTLGTTYAGRSAPLTSSFLAGAAAPVPALSATSGPTATVPSIPGLLLWLDAADPDADGDPTNNPADGSLLATWQDKSSLNNDATVTPGQNAGTFRSAGGVPINGNPVVQFARGASESIGTVYEVPSVTIRAGVLEDVTIFTVYRPTDIPSIHHGLWGNDNGAWDRFFLPYHQQFGDGQDDGLVSLGPVQKGEVVPDAGQVGVVRVLTVLYNGDTSGGANDGPINGSAVYFDGRLVTRFTDSTDAIFSQDRLYLGWDGNDGTYTGDIAEMIVYDRALDGCELQNVNQYLSVKYNIPLVPIPAPGGVRDVTLCNLQLWLKANGSVTHNDGDVSHWADESGQGADVVQSNPAQQPLYQTGQVNFNPSLTFGGGVDGDLLTGTLPTLIPDQPYTLFTVINPANVNADNLFGIGTPSGVRTSIGYHPNFSNQRLQFHWGDNLTVPGLLAGWQVATFRYTAQPSAVDRFLSFNGLQEASDDTDLDFPPVPPLFVGGFPGNVGPNYYTGEMGEFIFYTSALTPTAQTQVESYLAVKHGITLGTSATSVSYLDSSASIIWDGPANASYHYDVAGIGRDDASALEQRRSRSINAGALVTMEHGAPFASDRSYLLWGDNHLTTTFVITAGANLHMARIWTVQEQGTVGSVALSLPSSAGADVLLVDTDTDFSNATVLPLTDDGVGNHTASVDLATGQFFTFGQVEPTALRVVSLGTPTPLAGVPLALALVILATVCVGLGLTHAKRHRPA